MTQWAPLLQRVWAFRSEKVVDLGLGHGGQDKLLALETSGVEM
jgi:hypothetical protein